MEYNFEAEVLKHQQKELKAWRKEQSEKEDVYYKMVADEGYDNLHDYERDVTAQLMNRVLIAVALVICIVGWLIIK